MLVTRGRTPDPAVPGTFFAPHTGDVQLDAVLKADGLFVNSAYYGLCARTYWHRHAGGQLLLITGGEGVVSTRDGRAEIVRAGDVVHCPAGEEHWHGAAPDCFVLYTSISLGDTETLEAVDDVVYAAAWQG